MYTNLYISPNIAYKCIVVLLPYLSSRHHSITSKSLLFYPRNVLAKGESAYKNPKRESVYGGLSHKKERNKKIKLPPPHA